MLRPSTPTLPSRSFEVPDASSADIGRGVLCASFAGLGDSFALSLLDDRADERGVTFVLASTLLMGVLVCLPLGVPGSDFMAGVGREPVGFVGGVAFPLPATRGAIGVRAVRFEARVGFSGRFGFVDRSEAIGPIVLSSLLHLRSSTERIRLSKLDEYFQPCANRARCLLSRYCLQEVFAGAISVDG